MKNTLLFIAFFTFLDSFCVNDTIIFRTIVSQSHVCYCLGPKSNPNKFIKFTQWGNKFTKTIYSTPNIMPEETISKVEFDTIALMYEHQENKKRAALAKKAQP